jgi:hypothetical protein
MKGCDIMKKKPNYHDLIKKNKEDVIKDPAEMEKIESKIEKKILKR